MGKLVLGRTVGQSLIINTSDGDIRIDFLKTIGDTYRVAINAPKSVGIVRAELIDNKDTK